MVSAKLSNCNPLVSIIIPSYNYSHYLPETLDSLLSQLYTNWECIIVDDGSVDDTKDVVSAYMNNDTRFKYIYQENKGLPSARNTGIFASNGEYIQLLDADDLLDASKLSSQVLSFTNNPDVDIVYSEYLCFDDSDRTKTWTYSRVEIQGDCLEDFSRNWERGFSIPIHCMLFKKSCFIRWGAFDESFRYGKEDWDLHLKYSLNKAQYLFVNGVTAFYRVSAKSMARDESKMQIGLKQLLKKHIFYVYNPISIKLIFIRRYVECSEWTTLLKILSLMYCLLNIRRLTNNKCEKQ